MQADRFLAGIEMLSLDASIMAAIIIFLPLVAALNQLLFKTLQRVRAERESRTTAMITEAQSTMTHQLSLLSEFQATIKNARMEACRQQEQLRSEAMKKRAEAPANARAAGKQMIQDPCASIFFRVEGARRKLDLKTQGLARGMASTILGRSALDADSP